MLKIKLTLFWLSIIKLDMLVLCLKVPVILQHLSLIICEARKAKFQKEVAATDKIML